MDALAREIAHGIIVLPSVKGGDELEELFENAERFASRPDLFPWVVLTIVCIVLYKEKDLAKEYFAARIEYWRSKKSTDSLIPEVIRNNTAALDHNTAAVERWGNDRGENRRMIEHHEQMCIERERHLQEVLNRVDKTATENARKLDILEDRTDK